MNQQIEKVKANVLYFGGHVYCGRRNYWGYNETLFARTYQSWNFRDCRPWNFRGW